MRNRLFKGKIAICASCKQTITTKTKGDLRCFAVRNRGICGPCYLKRKAKERNTKESL
jgi:hypothetical protein